MATSNVTRINRELAKRGREERLARARGGYWRLHGGESHTFKQAGIYGWNPHRESYESALRTVLYSYEENGIKL